MENSRNNLWGIGIIAVLAALLIGFCACAFGLVVGMGIGQARARAQFDILDYTLPVEPDAPEMPIMPIMPDMEGMPGMPEMPEAPDLDEMMDFMGGAMVGEVVVDGPADRAGIAAGDLIVAVDGEQITEDTSLAELIGNYAPGDEATLTVVRMSQGQMNEEDVIVVLGANPDDESLGFLGVRFVPMFPFQELDTP